MTKELTIYNQVVEIDGQPWKIREAVSMQAARDAINTARCTGSVGAKHMRDDRACGGSKFVEADVVRLNDDGTERQPYGGNPPPDQGAGWGTAPDLFAQLKPHYHRQFVDDPNDALAWVKAVVGGARSPEFAKEEAGKLVELCADALGLPRLSLDQVAGLTLGQLVRVHVPVSGGVFYGDQSTEYQIEAPAGQLAVVTALHQYDGQGLAVTVSILTGAPGVVNVFDETDSPRFPLELLTPAETAIAQQLGAALELISSRYCDDLNGTEAENYNDSRVPDGDTFNDFSGEVEHFADMMGGKVGPAIGQG